MLAMSFYTFSHLCKSENDGIEDWFAVGSLDLSPNYFGLVNEDLRCLINLVG